MARLTLSRPEVRNAFNDELIQRLTEAFASPDPGVRAIVVAGEGPAFCAGGDLEWMRRAASYTVEENERDALKLANLFQTMLQCPVPILARVHGAAFGGGAGLVAACDVAIAAPEAKFAFSEVKLGLIPATISPFVIAKIGLGHARALFTTGEPFGAEHAQRIGLVHEVTSDLDAAIDFKLKNILSSGPKAIAEAKRLGVEGAPGLEESARRLAEVRAGEEGKEGVAAFLERRAAAFVEARP